MLLFRCLLSLHLQVVKRMFLASLYFTSSLCACRTVKSAFLNACVCWRRGVSTNDSTLPTAIGQIVRKDQW